MKVAVIGSRSITEYPLAEVIPVEATEIISGGARGVDALARAYAEAHGLPCTELLPDYARYAKGAPLRRNRDIIARADYVVAIWDEESRGTAQSIALAKALGKAIQVVRMKKRQTPEGVRR